MEAILSIGLGFGLSAACGFRVFVPFLVMGIAERTGHLQLASGFEWIGSDAALVALGLATVLEIAAYYVPWVDNLLDTAAAPTAVVAGVLATAATVTDMSPMMGWTVAVIGGGGIAGTIHTGMALLRGLSSLVTGGLGNPLVSTAEAGGAVTLAGIAVTLPLLGLAIVMTLVLASAVKVASRVEAKSTSETSVTP